MIPGPKWEDPGKAVSVSNVKFTYEGGVQALSSVSLEIRKGEYVAIVGGNGSGKTTLAKNIVGLLKPSSGTVLVEGRLPRLVGAGAAYKLLYTGDLIGAEVALRIGLVDEVVPAAELRTRALALAESIAQKSPVALQLIKEAVRALLRVSLDEGLRQETTLFGLAFSSEDKAEGVAAFLGKRPAEFKGR